MIAQRYPGQPKWSNDTAELRKKWFLACLSDIRNYMHENNLKSLAFPYKIGCGLAGGDWKTYLEMLETFGDGFKSPDMYIALYKYE